MGIDDQTQPSQYRLSQRQQYDSMIQAEAGPSSAIAAAHDPASVQSHPSYPFVSSLCDRYPSQSAPLFQTYLDLKHAASWSEVEAIELLPPSPPDPTSSSPPPRSSTLSPSDLIDATLSAWKSSSLTQSLPTSSSTGGWAAVRGRKNGSGNLQTVLPVHISQQISPALFQGVFDILLQQNQGNSDDLETQSMLLAMMAGDSSLVYYSLAKGLVKPVN